MKQRAAVFRRAFAELGVIILGVMIALAADRAIASSDDRALEEEYLERVGQDLRSNILETEAWIAEARQAARVSQLMLRWAGGEPVPDSIDAYDFLVQFAALSVYHPMGSERDAWEELAATGRLALVESVDVRRALGTVVMVQDGVRSSEEGWARTTRQYDDAALLMMPTHSWLSVLQWRDADHADRVMNEVELARPGTADLDALVGFFRSDPVARAHLARVHVSRTDAIALYGVLLEVAGIANELVQAHF